MASHVYVGCAHTFAYSSRLHVDETHYTLANLHSAVECNWRAQLSRNTRLCIWQPPKAISCTSFGTIQQFISDFGERQFVRPCISARTHFIFFSYCKINEFRHTNTGEMTCGAFDWRIRYDCIRREQLDYLSSIETDAHIKSECFLWQILRCDPTINTRDVTMHTIVINLSCFHLSSTHHRTRQNQINLSTHQRPAATVALLCWAHFPLHTQNRNVHNSYRNRCVKICNPFRDSDEQT